MRSGAQARMHARLDRAPAMLVAVALLVTLAAACQTSSNDSTERLVLTPLTSDIIAILVSSELTVGQNRFVLALQDQEDNLIVGADVHLRFFKLNDGDASLESEADTLPVAIQQEALVHEHQDGTSHAHTGEDVGVYVAHAEFDDPGLWGVEVEATIEQIGEGPVRIQFDVLERGSTPALGAPAPRSEQTTLRDVDDIFEIDSSIPSRPEMHELTIAEAIESGRPTVVAFATPAFCESRLCGPMMDVVVDPLFERYGDQAAFIHVEPFVLERARQGELIPVPAVGEWGLRTEPWLFVIDQEGRVAGKFEAIASVEEVEPVLRQVLGESAG